MITQAALTAELRALGLAAGDSVITHSSYKSLGSVVEGGPAGVVEAILQAVGPGGTAVFPTFTHSGCVFFDPLQTPGKNGAIPEAARVHAGAVRSWHPTHAATAIGPAAADLVRDDLERGALGRDSALDKLAKMVRTGASSFHGRNSLQHLPCSNCVAVR